MLIRRNKPLVRFIEFNRYYNLLIQFISILWLRRLAPS